MEKEIYQKFYGKLVNLIQVSPEALTIELYAKGLISTELKDRLTSSSGPNLGAYQRTLDLVSAVETRVDSDPNSFHKFLDLLRSKPDLSELVDEIDKVLIRELLTVTISMYLQVPNSTLYLGVYINKLLFICRYTVHNFSCSSSKVHHTTEEHLQKTGSSYRHQMAPYSPLSLCGTGAHSGTGNET